MASITSRSRKRRHVEEPSEEHGQFHSEERISTPTLAEPTQPIMKQPNNEIESTMLDDIRSIVTCNICFRLLYEPYTISCGHTYCYTCLCQWFSNNNEGQRKTCPGCRCVVLRAPAPSLAIRQITQKLVSHAESLPDGETLEQHNVWREQEAEAVERDKAMGQTQQEGVFPGLFKTDTWRRPLPVLHDTEDGVDRCPYCTWELEVDNGATCPHCGGEHAPEDENLDSSYSESADEDSGQFGAFSDAGSEELDDDYMDQEIASDHMQEQGESDENMSEYDSGHLPVVANHANHFADRTRRQLEHIRPTIRRHLPPRSIGNIRFEALVTNIPNNQSFPHAVSTSDEEDYDDDDINPRSEEYDEEEDELSDNDSSMSGFIDDDGEIDDDDDEDHDHLNHRHHGSWLGRPGISGRTHLLDESDIESNSTPTVQNSPHDQASNEQRAVPLSQTTNNYFSDDDDFDEGGAVSRGHRRRFN